MKVPHYLIVDACLNSSGIRDAVDGGYVEAATLAISDELVASLSLWLRAYEKEFFHDFEDDVKVKALDAEGRRIAKALGHELPGTKIEYYSAAYLTRERID